MTYASVCSGVEAASLAWEHLGFNPVFFSEIEPFPSAVLAARWPETPNLGDMTKIKFNHEKGIISNGRTNVAIPGGGIDLLVGGTPCQSFSVAGKREGLRGLSGLCLDYVRLAYEGRFKMFLWENVPGVFSSDKGRDFATFLSYMCGYEVDVPEDGWKTAGVVRNRRPDRFGLAWRVLDAQYVRVDGFEYAIPQRRRRVFVVGCLGDWTRAARILFEREGDVGDCPPRREQVEEVARSFGVGAEGADGVDAGIGACRTDTFENHAQDSRVKPIDVSDTRNQKDGTGGNNLPIVVCRPFVKTAHPRNPDEPQGYKEGEVHPTLNIFENGANEKRVACVVVDCIGIDQQGGKGTCATSDGVLPTMAADSHGTPHAVAINVTGGGACNDIRHACVREVRRRPDRINAQEQGLQGRDRPCCARRVVAMTHHEQDVFPTIDTSLAKVVSNQGDRAGQYVLVCQDREGKPGGGKGLLVERRNVMPCVDTNVNRMCVMVVPFAQNTRDEVRSLGAATGALAAEPGAKQQTYLACFPLDADKLKPSNNTEEAFARGERKGGNGFGVGSDGDPAYTVNTVDRHGVCVAVGINFQGGSTPQFTDETSGTVVRASNSSGNNLHGVMDVYNVALTGAVSKTIGHSATDADHVPCVILVPCIVRRLLPVETERLMGFPDGHTAPRFTPERIEQLIPDFIELFAEWDMINGKDTAKVRRKTESQVRKWLSAMGTPDQPDAPRYKACGNSMCVNCMRWIGKRIAKESGE